MERQWKGNGKGVEKQCIERSIGEYDSPFASFACALAHLSLADDDAAASKAVPSPAREARTRTVGMGRVGGAQRLGERMSCVVKLSAHTRSLTVSLSLSLPSAHSHICCIARLLRQPT